MLPSLSEVFIIIIIIIITIIIISNRASYCPIWIQKLPMAAKLNSAYGFIQVESPMNFYQLVISKVDSM